ncbi:MAG: hypothetical protein R3B72_26735 [Polyangiaceae bacterium]
MRDQISWEALSFTLHVFAILVALAIVRPLMMENPPGDTYEAKSVVGQLLRWDFEIIRRAAQRHAPAAPRLLFLVIPTLAFWFSGRKLRWTDWEHGRALRVLIMIVVVMLSWSGSTADYNMFFDRLHGFDRLLLVGFCAASWYTPLAVPFAARLAYILIRESYYPIPQDDFDFRPTLELLVVFSAFTWLSLKKSFKPAHFLMAGIGMWVSYYYLPGVAKVEYGVHWSWLDNHVTNLGMGGHIRGWLSFVPDSILLPIYQTAWKLDPFLTRYVIFLELGALVMCFITPKLTRLWFLLAFSLHFGIFILSGVCFWKWMLVDLAVIFWTGKSGKWVLADMHRYKLPALLAVASVFFSAQRIWYLPQIGVSWYDTRMVQNYEFVALGESGQRYLVDPNYFAPSDMHFVQGRMCYVAPSKQTTAIYGVVGSQSIAKALDEADSPEVAEKLLRRGRYCRGGKHDARRKEYVEFITRFFRNINRHHGKRHAWLRYIGRPTHLHVHQEPHEGELLFDGQEKVVALELWQEPIVWLGDRFHHFPRIRVHSLPIPD